MNRSKYIYVSFAILFVLLVAGAVIFKFVGTGSDSTQQVPGVDEPLRITKETQRTVKIGTREVSSGNFEKVEDGQIYYLDEGELTALPLTVDEIVLACTNQNLETATELDYDQIVKINIFTPDTIGDAIAANEFIVVFAADVEGVLRAHTVAIDASACE